MDLLDFIRTDWIRRCAWCQQKVRCFTDLPLFVCMNLPKRKPWMRTVAGRLGPPGTEIVCTACSALNRPDYGLG